MGKGEIVGFLGPNGAGKTTTLKILAGFLSPTSGVARINGHDLKAGDGAEMSEVPAVRIEGVDASEVLVFDLA